MATIDVSQAEAGMVLAADILDKRGRLLVPAGKELSAKHVRALPAWGVSRIEVEGDDIAGAVELEPWAVERATADVDALFSRVNRDHPLFQSLTTVCVERFALALQESGAAAPAAGSDEVHH